MNTPRMSLFATALALCVAFVTTGLGQAWADALDIMTNPSERTRPSDDLDRVISPAERKNYAEFIRKIIVNAFVAEFKKLDMNEKAKNECIEIVQSKDFNDKELFPRVERGAAVLTMRDIDAVQRGGQLTAPTMRKITELLTEVAEAVVATYKKRHSLK